MGQSEDERFWAKVRKEASGCWRWLGFIDEKGYPRFHTRGEQRAHRWAYRRFVGEIPAGLVLDHLCRRRWCVNPAHLRAVTSRQNTFADGSIAPAKRLREAPTCLHGHPWAENTAWNTKGHRYCIACQRVRGRASRTRLRATACPQGHVKVPRRDGKLWCPICFAATRRRKAPPTTFACGHLRAETGAPTRNGLLYCTVCRSEKRICPDSVRQQRLRS